MQLNYKRTILIGLSFMSILAFWQFYDQVIPYLLEYKFGLQTIEANSIMSIDNILAIFMLPLFGAISDRTKTRLGKRTPYILFGTIAASILMVILGLFEEKGNFWAFFFTLVLLLIVMAIYRTPAVAYMPDVTEKPLRSKANAIINLVGYVGGIFSMLAMMFLLKSKKNPDGEKVYIENQSFLPVFITVAVFMLITVLIMVFTTNENKLLAETNVSKSEDNENSAGEKTKLSKSVKLSLILLLFSVFFWYLAYNAVTTGFSRFCKSVLNVDVGTSSGYLLMATVAAIISFVPLGFLSSAIGRKKMVLLGIFLVTACYASAMFIKGPTPIMYAVFSIVGIGWAAINVNSFPMVVEMCTGSDVGKYTGYYYTFSMAAQIAAPLLSGLLINFIADRGGVGYNALFPFAVFFSVISFITMSLVKHGDVKPVRKKSIIENFDVDD